MNQYKLDAKIEKSADLADLVAFSQTVNDHNATCKAGDMLWAISADGDEYVIVEHGIREG